MNWKFLSSMFFECIKKFGGRQNYESENIDVDNLVGYGLAVI